MNIGYFIANLIEVIFNGAQVIYKALTTDFNAYMGKFGNYLSYIGIDLNGYSFLGILGGVGLISIIIYSIFKG